MKRFLEWEQAGFFQALWKAVLAEYDDLKGIAWRWQSIDGAMMKVPLAQKAVSPKPRRIGAGVVSRSFARRYHV